jgi:succinate dehydrogenase/fumarate reductase-like Fe-S protein
LASESIEISVAGEPVQARAGETIIHALWAAGMGDAVTTGCVGGVCGACTVSIRFKDGKPGGTDLACLRPVEEGMEVFPCPVDSIPAVAPSLEPSVENLQAAFPTLNRCTKCGSCTTACPMTIPVMDSVLRMQEARFDEVSDDFTTCIHCGLCRFVCEDKVKPHNMGLWVRRSEGMSRDNPSLDQSSVPESGDLPDQEWTYLLTGDHQERLKRAKYFREHGRAGA